MCGFIYNNNVLLFYKVRTLKNNFSFPFLSCPQTLSGSCVLTFAGTWATPPWAAAPSSGSSAPPTGSSTPHAPPLPCCPERLRSLSSVSPCGLAWLRQACRMTVTGIRCLRKAIKTQGEKNVRWEFSTIILFLCVCFDLQSKTKFNWMFLSCPYNTCTLREKYLWCKLNGEAQIKSTVTAEQMRNLNPMLQCRKKNTGLIYTMWLWACFPVKGHIQSLSAHRTTVSSCR